MTRSRGYRFALLGLLLALARPAKAQGSYEYLQAFSGVLNHIRLNYVDQVGYDVLVRAAIEGTLRALDPHSYYVSRDDWRRLSALERGELAVTGLVVEDSDDGVVVLRVGRKSPGYRAGLQPGDRVVAVSDTTTAGLTAVDVALRLAGDKGSKVRITVERGPRLEPDSLTVTVKREFPDQIDVSSGAMLDSVTGYVRLEGFGPDAADQLKEALEDLDDSGARQAVLDLRSNPGGLVTQAVEVSQLFLPKNTLVFRTDGRKAEVDEEYRTAGNGKFRELPLVVLIDEASASASEAVAGALQDHDRAVIVGRRSFGKALMQTLFLVPATGDNLWLTVARIQSPSGRVIQRPYRGIGTEQYRSLAGTRSSTDTASFATASGREVLGGGGIRPDVIVPAPPSLPVWWSMAADSGFTTSVADSVAFALPETEEGRIAWLSGSDWDATVLEPLLSLVRDRMSLAAELKSGLREYLARELALRVAEVRWGDAARIELALETDPDVLAARRALAKVDSILAAPSASSGP